MARNVQLTWHAARKCWKKVYRGRVYYFAKGECQGKSDRQGYSFALAEWEHTKHEIDAEARRADEITRAREILQGQQTPVPAEQTVPALDLKVFASYTDYESLGIIPPEMPHTPLEATRISELLAMYLKERQDLADAEEISAKTYLEDRAKLADFENFLVQIGRRFASGMDADAMSRYRLGLLKATTLPTEKDTPREKRGISAWTAKNRLKISKQFVMWLGRRHETFKVPGVVAEPGYARVDIPAPEPKVFTVAEVRALFEAASLRTKTYIALALNCGYRQTDISTLEYDFVDWDKGIITRPRHKSKVPQVHKLWRATTILLQCEQTTDESPTGPMLLDAKGQKLYRTELSPEGKGSNYDSIRLAFDRVKKRLKMDGDGRGFSVLRNTGADAIAQQYPADPVVVDQYLGHGRVEVRHSYARRHYDTLFEALDWLEGHFDLTL